MSKKPPPSSGGTVGVWITPGKEKKKRRRQPQEETSKLFTIFSPNAATANSTSMSTSTAVWIADTEGHQCQGQGHDSSGGSSSGGHQSSPSPDETLSPSPKLASDSPRMSPSSTPLTFGSSGSRKKKKQLTLPEMISRNSSGEAEESFVDLSTLPNFRGGSRTISCSQPSPLKKGVEPGSGSSTDFEDEEELDFGHQENHSLDLFEGEEEDWRPMPRVDIDPKAEVKVEVKVKQEVDRGPSDLIHTPPRQGILNELDNHDWQKDFEEMLERNEMNEDEGEDWKVPVTSNKDKKKVDRDPKVNAKVKESGGPSTSRPKTIIQIPRKKEFMNDLNMTADIFRDFDKVPERRKMDDLDNSMNYRTVRNKEERAKMSGWDCDLCREYYKDLEADMHPSELQRLKNNCSRHRSHRPLNQVGTPPDLWKTVMPSTEEAFARGIMAYGQASPSAPPKRYDLLENDN